MNPNNMQVGGDHYRSKFQHWDLVLRCDVGYLEGCASKYVTRWRRTTTGKEDLRKAVHYVEKLIAVVLARNYGPLAWRRNRYRDYHHDVSEFAAENGLSQLEALVVERLVCWNSFECLTQARDAINKLIAVAEGFPDELDLKEPEPVPLTEENHYAERSGGTVRTVPRYPPREDAAS